MLNMEYIRQNLSGFVENVVHHNPNTYTIVTRLLDRRNDYIKIQVCEKESEMMLVITGGKKESEDLISLGHCEIELSEYVNQLIKMDSDIEYHENELVIGFTDEDGEYFAKSVITIAQIASIISHAEIITKKDRVRVEVRPNRQASEYTAKLTNGEVSFHMNGRTRLEALESLFEYCLDTHQHLMLSDNSELSPEVQKEKEMLSEYFCEDSEVKVDKDFSVKFRQIFVGGKEEGYNVVLKDKDSTIEISGETRHKAERNFWDYMFIDYPKMASLDNLTEHTKKKLRLCEKVMSYTKNHIVNEFIDKVED